MLKPIRILFLCVANSARSQLAEGIAKEIFKDSALIQSAGSEPSGVVHPMAIEIMKEKGIDISKNKSKAIDQLPQDFMKNIDFIVTLCAEEICPVVASKAQKMHWPIEDPASVSNSQRKEAFAKAYDQIHEKVLNFYNLYSKLNN